jgi:glycosyltransferase involved in cell wall biosynthesis
MSDESTRRPVVDVGIPTRERPDLVRQAIDSVLAQTLTGWRLVVSENGPGGGVTEAAVAPYLADPRISYVVTGADVGGAENWTRLIQGGDAPYVALLHDDDLWDPTFLERRVAFLERHPDCGFVFSGNKEIDANGEVIGESTFVLPEGSYPPESMFPLLYEHNVIAVPSILVRRAAYEAVGPYFDAAFFPFWDYEMWLRIAARFPGGCLAVRDCSYRMHDVRMTFTVRHFGQGYLQAIDRADQLLADFPQIRVEPRLRRRRRAQALLTTALDALESGDRHAGRRRLREAVRLYPRIAADVRFSTAMLALVAGRAGTRALARARFFVHHREIRLHRRVRPRS